MSCKYLVAVFLFFGAAVMGASVANESSSSSNDSLKSNSTIIRPKLVSLPLNHTALNSSKSSNASDVDISRNKTEKHGDGIVPRSLDSVELKNLSALNSSQVDAKTNASVIEKSKVDHLNGTVKAGNATVNSSSKVERAIQEKLNLTTESRNITKQSNSSDDSDNIKLASNVTSSSNSSKIVVRAVVDKDALNSTKALNASSITKANATSSAASANVSASISSSSTKEANATDKANTTVRPVQLLKADNSTLSLSKGNSAIRLLRRREAETTTEPAEKEDKENKEDTEDEDVAESSTDEDEAASSQDD